VYGELHMATFDATDMDIAHAMSLGIVPPELEEIYLVVHYKMGDDLEEYASSRA